MRQIALLLPTTYIYAHDYFSQYWTRSGQPTWGDVEFVVNPPSGSFEGAIVLQSMEALDKPYELIIPANHSILAILEPPDLLFLPSGYVQQFGAVVGCDWRWNYRRRLSGPAGHGWFVETNIAHFDSMVDLPKPKLISAVISAKQDTQQHRKRLRLMEGLKEHFGDKLDWFGRGVMDLGERKIDGLRDYRYHVVIENGCWRDYWTEKIADAFVANCFPFYCGAPNIFDYFPRESMEIISLDDLPATIASIEAAIYTNRQAAAQGALLKARQLVKGKFHRYQLFRAYLERLPKGRPQLHKFRPHTDFYYSIRDRILNKLWQRANS
jgi:Glycosyltransferase family 10 (fucosyltransferase) C-term